MLKVYLTDDVQRRLWAFVQSVGTEIGGFGYCTAPEQGVVVVDTILLAPQTVSGASVDFTDDAMAYMIEKAANDGRLADARFSWHSHAGMGVYWSNTDEDGIEDYSKSGMPWLISLVANKKSETKARLDVFDIPLVGRATFHNNIDVVELRDNSIDEQIKAEVEQFVETKSYTYTAGSYKGKQKEKDDKELTEQEFSRKGKELELRGSVTVNDGLMEADEFILWQKFLRDEPMTKDEEERFDKYLNGETPEVIDGQAVLLG